MDPPRDRTCETAHGTLVTRSDFDGLVCGILLRDLDLIDDIEIVHPKDMQDGIITNLPYGAGWHFACDHHSSQVARKDGRAIANHVIDASAPSAVRAAT